MNNQSDQTSSSKATPSVSGVMKKIVSENWNPNDIGGKDIKKDFIARCHVEVGAGGFLRFPLPGDKKGRNWLDERLMADFLIKSLNQVREETKRETIAILKKVFDDDLNKALAEKDRDKSGDSGFALGVFERAVKSIANNTPINEPEYEAKIGFVLLPERRCSHCSCRNNK